MNPDLRLAVPRDEARSKVLEYQKRGKKLRDEAHDIGVALAAPEPLVAKAFTLPEWQKRKTSWVKATSSALEHIFAAGDAPSEFRRATTVRQMSQLEKLDEEVVLRTEREALQRGLAKLTDLEREIGPVLPPREPRRVMVVHGRNEEARRAMFTFLRALGLHPTEWDDAIRDTGLGTPHNLDAVRAAMHTAQAVVVVLTAEDRAALLPDERQRADPEALVLRGQPRPNVWLEAGMAMGIDQRRVILVQLGPIRGASDFEGLNKVMLSNDGRKRQGLMQRLKTAGCAVNESGGDWLSPEAGGDFEGSVIAWEPTPVP